MEEYVRTDDVSHILLRPDAYVGSKAYRRCLEYIVGHEGLTKTSISKSPALERTFIEILSNSVDNALRGLRDDKRTIKVTVTPTECSVWNDGNFIPVEMNKKEDMYNHTLIFGYLRSSSNYDDTKTRFVSGRNGFGAKLTNVFSTKFTVEGIDPDNGKRLVQTWTDNMKNTDGPVITSTTRKTGSTCISWILDFSQFGIDQYDENTIALFKRHTLDAALVVGCSVYFNGEKLPNTLQKYVSMIDPECTDFLKLTKTTETKSSQVIITPSKEFEAISFVNGIRTKNGGKHVDAWVEAVCRPVVNKVNTKTTNLTIKDIKKHLRFVIISLIPNPTFESQEKTCLESPDVPADHITPSQVTKILTKWGIRDLIRTKEDEKDRLKVTKAIANKKHQTIPGYDRANNSGGKYTDDCTLILCEGLSAKTFAVEGITHGLFGRKGRDWFGIYPLRGKFLNVRKATSKSISYNEVITNLITILGLDYARPDRLDKLKYGKVCIIVDADTDGIHIKGLLLNFFHCIFPTMMDRVVCMYTPIIRIGRTYYYDKRTDTDGAKGPTKYFKGLGTTEPQDIKSIFGKKMSTFHMTESTQESFDLAFGKATVDDRKRWIQRYNPNLKSNTTIDSTKDQWIPVNIEDFVDQELVQFAYDDCVRSIPSVYDGLKESQRKILYAAKKRKNVEMKLTQFSGYVSEQTDYQHGEQNLIDTVVKMAQDFCGSNNIPIFSQKGMFGTRLSGGKDAASGRYLHTKLEANISSIFPTTDDSLIPCTEDHPEPVYYVPIVPILLINGCKGIGTGWQCTVPCYSVEDVVANTIRWIDGTTLKSMVPSYNGFKGTITKLSSGKYEIKGTYSQDGNVFTVSELPVGYWNDKFKEWCGTRDDILDLKDRSTTKDVTMQLITSTSFDPKVLDKELTTIINTNNITVMLGDGSIKHVSIKQVYDMWGTERRRIYAIRKEREIGNLDTEISSITSVLDFIAKVKKDPSVLFGPDVPDIPLKQLSKEEELRTKVRDLTETRTMLTTITVDELWKSDLSKTFTISKK